METVPNIELKDNQRLFSREQRLAIFRRDKALCQVRMKCSGAKCEWDAWEADHVVPWSKGGKTVVANGQIACLACNSSKGDS
ncbi:MAG: HNH endonuclease signature motif containing protein [Tepidisphaeraceae bacterium]|jgi:5-methylcytosine-specific restriction endonuclease McrA